MKLTILTLFPHFFTPIFKTSILKRAAEKDLVTFNIVDIRDFAPGARKNVDDKPYGGGVGMIMRVDVLARAIESAKCKMQNAKCRERIILTDPKGSLFTQQKAKKLSIYDHLIIVCGHYEGVDARIKHFIDETISIGDYVLTGGEIPAMVISDTIVRLVPGVIRAGATETESFEEGFLEYPQYTRPSDFQGYKVPNILLSGNHKEIAAWRKSMQEKVARKNH